MENEKRLIYANELLEVLELCEFDTECDRDTAYSQIKDAPTVDAVVLPCEVGTQVWLTKWWGYRMKWEKTSEPLPRNIHHFDISKAGVTAHFHDGCINVKYFGEIVFLTREEAEAALAKMDGDGK